MAIRDRLKKGKQFEVFKKQRNKVKSLVRSAKISDFDKLIESDKSIATIWKAINEIKPTNLIENKATPPQLIPLTHLIPTSYH